MSSNRERVSEEVNPKQRDSNFIITGRSVLLKSVNAFLEPQAVKLGSCQNSSRLPIIVDIYKT